MIWKRKRERKLLVRAINQLSSREKADCQDAFLVWDNPDGIEKISERSSRFTGNFTVIHFPSGEKDHAEIEAGKSCVMNKLEESSKSAFTP